MARSRSEYAILAIALFGIIIAGYAVTLHYAPSASHFCNIGTLFNCDKVNKSIYSEILGIPVSILGALSYLGVFLATLKRRTIQRALAFTNKDWAQYFLGFVIVMLAFQVYLTMTEVLFIHSYCLVCLASQLATLALTFFAWRQYRV